MCKMCIGLCRCAMIMSRTPTSGQCTVLSVQLSRSWFDSGNETCCRDMISILVEQAIHQRSDSTPLGVSALELWCFTLHVDNLFPASPVDPPS